tara:strand:+ start:498 stop:860 length:363 start_codon:yes stop_codon:yes gene_type:complete
MKIFVNGQKGVESNAFLNKTHRFVFNRSKVCLKKEFIFFTGKSLFLPASHRRLNCTQNQIRTGNQINETRQSLPRITNSAIWAYRIYKPNNNLNIKINPKVKMINKINPLKACQIKLNIT